MKMKNRLDEMQEQELLKVESNGCWLAFWGLVAAMMIQCIVYRDMDFRTIGGEWILLMILAIYIAFGCMRHGIWDRHIPMNNKTNLIVSAISGTALAIFNAFMTYRNYRKPVGSIAAAIVSGIIAFTVCFIALSIAMKGTIKRAKRLEEEPDDADRL